MKYLQAKGFRVIPVNPKAAAEGAEILGEKAYGSLADIPDRIDMVDVFRNSEAAGPIVDEAISVAEEKGISVIWMQLGVRNDEAAERAEEAGLKVKANTVDMSGWFAARTYAETLAWSKVLVDAETDQIVGAHLIGHHGEELIHLFALAMRHGISASDLTDTIFAFPTFSADLKNMI